MSCVHWAGRRCGKSQLNFQILRAILSRSFKLQFLKWLIYRCWLIPTITDKTFTARFEDSVSNHEISSSVWNWSYQWATITYDFREVSNRTRCVFGATGGCQVLRDVIQMTIQGDGGDIYRVFTSDPWNITLPLLKGDSCEVSTGGSTERHLGGYGPNEGKN